MKTMRSGILDAAENYAASMRLKGIDQFNSQISKTSDISRRNTGVVGQSDRCYQSIHLLNSTPLSFTAGRYTGVVRSGRLIERKDPSLEELAFNPVYRGAQEIFSAAAL
jgi:hypothetical protein